MKFQCEGRVAASPDVVYAAIRDHLPRLTPYLDNVERIEELEREPLSPGRTRVLNRWRADAGNVPAAVRPFLKPDMLEWLDHAEWDDAGQHVDWRLEPNAFKELYACRGRNRMVAAGTGTRVVIEGDLNLDPSKVPGVPTFVAKRALPALEAYLIERIRPNLAALAEGVGRYLKAQR